jgi:hypothetical protein
VDDAVAGAGRLGDCGLERDVDASAVRKVVRLEELLRSGFDRCRVASECRSGVPTERFRSASRRVVLS